MSGRFLVTVGHQGISRTLGRIENLNFGKVNAQNDHTNIGKVHLNLFLTCCIICKKIVNKYGCNMGIYMDTIWIYTYIYMYKYILFVCFSMQSGPCTLLHGPTVSCCSNANAFELIIDKS